MPLYEYQCTKCGHRFEVIQKFSDRPLSRCPECKGKLEKLLSAPAIQFKGSGWYVTDYAGKGDGSSGSSREKGDSKDSQDGKNAKDAKQSKDSKEKSKSETKPAAGKDKKK